jgi:hypothetical protein
MDRQDIDALLIGALYGELTPADEARLTAHLDSHPTDRGALDDLKSARHAVRESRIFDLQLDPPQAVSALLLQEAHRRAPKRVVATEEKEGWFFRFSRSFLAHPAMAAAAMLVLVVGVAGTLYMRKGNDIAERETVQLDTKSEVTATAPVEMVPPTAQDPGAGNQGVAEGSSYQVGLADKTGADEGGEKLEATRSRELAKGQSDRQDQKNKKTAIMVDTPNRQPKDLDESRAKSAKKSADRTDNDDGFVGAAGTATLAPGASTGAGGGASNGRVATTPTTTTAPARNEPAPPPPVVASPAPSGVAQSTAPAKPATKPAAAKATVAKEAESKPDAAAPAKDANLIAWAKGQHSATVALASKGDCSGAAKLAVSIQNRAPEYYSQYMTTDRALKKCQPYITAEREADAERSGKARAQKRVNADEPAATSK